MKLHYNLPLKCHFDEQFFNNKILDSNLLCNIKQQISKLIEVHPLIPIILPDSNQIRLSRQTVCQLLSLVYSNLALPQLHNNSLDTLQNELQNSGANPLLQQKQICLNNYFKLYFEHQKDIEYNQIIFKLLQFDPKYHLHDYFENSSDHNFLDLDLWIKSNVPLSRFAFKQSRLEDLSNSVIVDFADPQIGLNTLDSKTCAQEQIMFLCYPECLVASLIVPRLQDNQALLIENALRYNNYSGYQNTFKACPLAKPQQLNQRILAIDALKYNDPKEQFLEANILRDLNKAFIGFCLDKHYNNVQISSGKWGCGVFKGDPELKFLSQWCAYSQSRRKSLQYKDDFIIFHSSSDIHFFEQQFEFYRDKYQTVGRLLQFLIN